MINIRKIIYIILILLVFATKVNAKIEDSLFITVGNIAITKLDIMNEIKVILILNNVSYSEDKREKLQEMAIKASIKRNIKKIAIDKYDFLKFKRRDLKKELTKLANNINVDLDTLKNICESNELNFSLIEEQVETELLWNSFIFHMYKDRISINSSEIEEQLKLFQNKKEFTEYLISEILYKPVRDKALEIQIQELIKKVEIESFERVAMNLSVSESSIKGGDLGWLDEDIISKKLKSTIINTPIGSLSKPIILPEGVLIFKLRDKRNIEKNIDLEQLKNRLVNQEKQKILKMYSLSHYDKLRRSVSVKFFNE